MSQPTPTSTFCGFSLPPGTTVDIDPLDATCHCLVAVTGPGGEVRVRLWVPEAERSDWAKVVGMMRG